MEQEGLRQSSGQPAVAGSHEAGLPATAMSGRVQQPEFRDQPDPEREALLAKVQRLEAELERYRSHAQRTSKMFLSASNFADWVRESARRDAETTLRKARARAERLGALEEDLERAEQELTHLQAEVERMQALTEETRARLTAFLTAGLQALSDEAGAARGDGPDADIGDALHERLGYPSTPPPVWVAGLEPSER